ncbi:MAG: KamA family radical SAM protein [Polyangiaceae bacterium]
MSARAPRSLLEPRVPAEWQREMREAIGTLEALEREIALTPAERAGVERAAREGLPMRITRHYLELMDRADPACPIRRQAIPVAEEADITAGEMVDPLGEVAHEVAPRLVRRYPDRALLLVTDRCALYCRFCTRSRMVGDGGGAAAVDALGPALTWLAEHPEIRDVIVSGGDPLTLSTSKLVSIVERLRAIASIDTIRLATRVPVTLPSRITSELVDALRPHHPIWVMTHFNHPKELAPAAIRALERLADAGFPVMNQAVLLRGVNDDPDVLTALFRGLVRARVRPYYLLQMDPVVGTSHLRTPLARGREIMDALQGRLSGIALPKFIVDTPGGMGKVPAGPSFVVEERPGSTVFRTHKTAAVEYVDPQEPR